MANKHKGKVDCENAEKCGSKGLKRWQVVPASEPGKYLCSKCSVAANNARRLAKEIALCQTYGATPEYIEELAARRA